MSDKPINTVNTGGHSTRDVYEDTKSKQKDKEQVPKPKPATKK